MTRRLYVPIAFAWLLACSSSSSGDGGGPGDPDGGGGGGTDGGGAQSDGGASPDTAPAAYAGGDVTVTIGGADGGTVDTAAVSGKVTIHIVPANPSAITKIEALVDGTVVGTLTQAPYDLAWDSASVSNGAHAVSARPYDTGGVAGSAPAVAITTTNFLLAGKWKWTSITDATPGFGADPCSDATFTVTFDQASSTMTLPMFYLKCTAQNGAPYSAKINGFSKLIAPADYGGPVVNTSGTVTTTLSSTKLTQSDSFNGDTQSGTLTKQP
jgi:hypothetical protein